jgi:PAS domain S-box-containing protein
MTIYESVVQSIFKGIAITDRSFNIIRANDYLCNLTGSLQEEIQFQSLHDIIDGDVASAFGGLLDGRVNPGDFSNEVTVNLVDRSGRKTVVSIVSAQIPIKGEPHYVFLINKENLAGAGKLVNRLLKKVTSQSNS